MESGMKYAVVTGATKGIGRAIAERLLEEKYFVFINYAHDEEEAERLSEYLKKREMDRFSMIKADLSVPDNIEYILKGIYEVTESIDALILNAGVTDRSIYKEITWESWSKVINTNLSVPFFLTQKMYHIMNPEGNILMIGSVLGKIPHATSCAYGVSKAGIQFLAKELVKEFAAKKVRVNAVCPGFTDTPWQKDKTLERKRKIEDKIALNRFAEPEEIADMCWAVIKNTYINGSVIDINGGYSFR